jgi:hypothetical protein
MAFAVLGKLVDYDDNYNKIATKEVNHKAFFITTLKES